MGEARADRRVAWVAASLDITRRPLALAEWVRGHGMAPPPVDATPSLEPRESASARAERILRNSQAAGIRIETPDDEGWMKRFWVEMADPPPSLFVRGALHAPEAPAVAVVGSRHPSEAGVEIAHTIARDLAACGVVVVSGLAMGIDAAAHRGALEGGGRTVAVLASGVDRITPVCNRSLGEGIAEAGALVSEFPPGTGCRPLHFPRRNRILAALAEVVLVVEGRAKSGARSTVQHAIDLGREVAAVPRDPLHAGAALPNTLIRSGSTPVTCALELLELLRGGDRLGLALAGSDVGVARPAAMPAPDAADSLEGKILGRLSRGGRSFESLRREGICAPDALLALLGRLEALGLIRRMPGMRFSRATAAR